MSSVSVKKNAVVFLDIDGPMIPGRAYTMPTQTKPLVMTFDPCAVGLLNNWCETRGWKIVLHSSWLRFHGEQETVDHCIKQGIEAKHIYEAGPYCKGDIHYRYDRIEEYLVRHPEITHFMILDDEPYRPSTERDGHVEKIRDRLILVDFEDGMTQYVLNQMNGRDWRRFDS